MAKSPEPPGAKDKAGARPDQRPGPTGNPERADSRSDDILSKRRPTMTDVARIAGVSQSSVSLVLNQTTGARISEATRSRVREAAAQIGYQLPGQRRLDRSAHGRDTIAYLVDEISTSPSWARMRAR